MVSMKRTVCDFASMATELRASAGAEVLHAAQHLAVGDARGDERGLVGVDQAVHRQHVVDVAGAHLDGAGLLLGAAPLEAAHEAAADALHRRAGEHAFGSGAGAEVQVDAGALDRGGDGAEDVAVGDEADAGAGRADLGDEVDVALALQDADDEVLDVAVERLGDVADVLGRRSRRCGRRARPPGRPRSSSCRCRAREAACPSGPNARTASELDWP